MGENVDRDVISERSKFPYKKTDHVDALKRTISSITNVPMITYLLFFLFLRVL